MSASQARLLSITARLNHVELETQYLSNAKIRLSDSTQKASDKYVAALNKTEYQYNYYNAAGEKITMDLTGAALTEYGELKNQYGLINSAGQILVSETDAANFQNSNTLEEFLEKYGVLGELGEGDAIQIINPEYEVAWDNYEEEYSKWQTEKPDPADPIYQIPGDTTVEYDYYDNFMWATAACFASAIGALRGYMAEVYGTEFPENETICDKDGNKIVDIYLAKHYGNTYEYWYRLYDDAESGKIVNSDDTTHNFRCYSHVFSHLLKLGDYTTTTGNSFTIRTARELHPELGVTDIYSHWWSDDATKFPDVDTNNRYERSQELAALLSEDAETVLYACGDTGADITPESSDIEKLLSDYYFDENGEKQLKTIQQKMVDLNYLSVEGNLGEEGGVTYQQLYDSIWHFVDHDIKNAFQNEEDGFDQEAYDKDVAEWEAAEPSEPTISKYIDQEVRKIEDLDKAQWYVNLWHRMNGTSDFKAGFGNSEDYIAGNGWASKSETDQNWAVLKDGDMHSPEYLKYAIENGLITIEQVQFTDPSESGTGIENAVWTSIVFSSAQDITEQKDQVAITIAETEYNQTLREIEAKDKEYDTQIKKLDTEHNALQTEYDSIKSVIEKNVERSFKIFS